MNVVENAVESAVPAGSKTPVGLARLRRSVGLALLLIYVPQLSGLVLGPIAECDHCVDTYFSYYPLLPGLFAGFSSVGPSRLVISAVTSLCLIGLVAFGMQRLNKRGRWALALSIGTLSVVNGWVVSNLLRM